MDCDMLDLLHEEFPKIDARILKATVLEHGDDVKSAFIFLRSIADDDCGGDASVHLYEETDYCRSSAMAAQQNSLTASDCNSTVTSPQEDASIRSDKEDIAPELSNSISQISLSSLEEIVEAAQKDKEIVVNLVEEVGNLRGKADEERAAALRAENEAAASGDNLLRKADELRKESAQKKQDNLLRMGEIYGEKAILATEARGLKTRLEEVNRQKDRAVTVLNEIKVRLQDSCGEALEKRLIAEEDGREKEKLAQDILQAEETLRAVIEEESKKLDMEAEACLQLKEFLSFHASIIDSIQGEMCVLCEDVESFKRQVDGGMWSSINSDSLPPNVNPEGPYIFRKYKAPSISSSQESGNSFEALCNSKQVCSILSTPSSQGMAGSTDKLSNGSNQVNHDDVVQQLSSEGSDVWDHARIQGSSIWNRMNTELRSMLIYGSDRDTSGSLTNDEKLYHLAGNSMNSESHDADGTEVMGSNVTDDANTEHFQGERSPTDGLGLLKASPSGGHFNRNWAFSESDDSCEDTTAYDASKEPTTDNNHIAEGSPLPSTPHTLDEWFSSPIQMEESTSSTSSSLIKIEADDYISC